MNGSRERLDDDVLAWQLERRATGARLSVEDRERLIAAATARQVVRPGPSRWNIFSAPIAAALVVALVAGVTILGSIPSGPADTPPTGPAGASLNTSSPRSTDAHNESIRVLSTQELAAAIATTAADEEERVVIANATVEIKFETDLTCDADGACTIGRLVLPGGFAIVHAAEDVRATLPPPGERLDGVLVLSLRTEPDIIEYLGPITSPAQGLIWPAEAVADASVAPGSVILVDGWLVTADGNFPTCGPFPPPRPTLPPDSPFECYVNTWVTPSSYQPVTPRSNGASLDPPEDGIPVQRRTYQRFAPDPAFDAQGLSIPQRAVYVLRAVEDDWADCRPCRGWRIVGRIDPPEPPPPAGAPQLGELPVLVLRAEAAVPDSTLSLPDAMSLVSTARKLLLDRVGDASQDLADRPLAAAAVDAADDRDVRIRFHDYGDGRSYIVVLRVEAGEAVALESVTVRSTLRHMLSAWEEDEAGRIALEVTGIGAWGGTFARSTASVPCPDAPGWCASLELVTDEFVDPPIVLAEVIVDIGREEVLHEDPPRPTPPAMSTPPRTPRPDGP